MSQLLVDTPPPRAVDMDALRSLVLRSERRVLAVDDDPTGTQTVHDVPLITRWDDDDLEWAFRQPSPLAVAVTNSRSMQARRAAAAMEQVGRGAARMASSGGFAVSLLSRGDSTLRGHFPLETDALSASWTAETGATFDGMVLCPAYVEAGRITVDDIHWVVQDGMAIPVGETEFAKDATFGFRSSNLKEWVAEKTANRWSPGEIESVSLDELRVGGLGRVVEKLRSLSNGRPVVVNAAEQSDLDLLALAMVRAELLGTRLLCRCGPSLLRARAGLHPRGAIEEGQLFEEVPAEGSHGLIVVGSHVGLTNQQIDRALALGGLVSVEISVPSVLDASLRTGEIVRAARMAIEALAQSNVLLVTSREVVRALSPDASLRLTGEVSAAVVEVVREVCSKGPFLRYLLTKGGITSSDVLRDAMGFRRGWVVGQVLDGMVSVWVHARSGRVAPGPEASRPTFPLVVFAGNVGGPDGLADVVRALSGSPRLRGQC